MIYNAYFDESGDLGWSLDKPFRKGGSSKYFTIAYILLPSTKGKFITRFIKKFHQERGGSEREYKGSDFTARKAKVTARKIVGHFQRDHDIIIGSITIKKDQVPAILQNTRNSNILYNHMIQALLCNTAKGLEEIHVIPDRRSVPNGSQNSCADLIKHKLWCELDSSVKIGYQPGESRTNQHLQFIDWIANFIWRNYEDGHIAKNCEAYQILSPLLQEQTLYP